MVNTEDQLQGTPGLQKPCGPVSHRWRLGPEEAEFICLVSGLVGIPQDLMSDQSIETIFVWEMVFKSNRMPKSFESP